MAQTSVVWLMERYYAQRGITVSQFEEAIQMEKEQIKDAWVDGMKSDNGHFGTADDYYTQTYGTRLQNETN